MDQTSYFDPIIAHLKNTLHTEWLIEKSEQTTCEGPATLIRVDSEYLATKGRARVCFIRIREKNIIINTPYVLSKRVQEVVRNLKPIVYHLLGEGYHVTLTECSLLCESCFQAHEAFHASH